MMSSLDTQDLEYSIELSVDSTDTRQSEQSQTIGNMLLHTQDLKHSLL